MRLLLVVAAGTAVVLLVPAPPGVFGIALYGAWALLLGGLAVWQTRKLLAANRHLLGARLGFRPPRASDDYVKALFAAYAHRYDAHLFQELAYNGPNLVRDAVGERLDHAAGRLVVGDLGCGTGACGPLFRRLAGQLIGVDLAAEMLAQAARGEVYDDLHQAEISEFLRRQPAATFDLLIAADVLVYVGDLAPLLQAAAQALRPGGLFALTVERAAGQDFVLNRSGRYAHPPAYVARAALSAGLTILETRPGALRTEADQPVEADVWLLERPA